MKKFFVFIFSLVFLWGVGCTQIEPIEPMPLEANLSMSERVTFLTSDGVKIVGDYYAGGEQVVLLLHMRPATRASWRPFAETLVQNGFSVLAIDLRGHGESTEKTDGTKLNYNSFSETQEQASIHDVEAAVQWLVQERGSDSQKMVLVGASIGANLAAQYLSEHHEVAAAALLSPGLDYRGIQIAAMMEKLTAPQAIYYVAAEDDSYSAESVRTLAGRTPVSHQEQIFVSGGHGTNLFETQPPLIDDLVRWVGEQVK